MCLALVAFSDALQQAGWQQSWLINCEGRMASIRSWSSGLGDKMMVFRESLKLGQPAIVGATSTVLGMRCAASGVSVIKPHYSVADWVLQIVVVSLES